MVRVTIIIEMDREEHQHLGGCLEHRLELGMRTAELYSAASSKLLEQEMEPDEDLQRAEARLEMLSGEQTPPHPQGKFN